MASEVKTAAGRYIRTDFMPSATGTAWLPDTLLAAAVAQALSRYDRDCPREITQAFVATDPSSRFSLAAKLTTPYTDADCQVVRIAAPWDIAEAGWIPSSDYTIVADPSSTPAGAATVLLANDPGVGSTIAVAFIAPHEDTTCTVKASHREAVGALAAAFAARMLAARFTGGADPTIGADIFNGQNIATQYLALAKDLESMYRAVVTGGAGAGAAAGEAAQPDPASAEIAVDMGDRGYNYKDLVGTDGFGN
jgi:hypothetical protein